MAFERYPGGVFEGECFTHIVNGYAFKRRHNPNGK